MPYSVRKEIIQNKERYKHICFFDMEEILKKSLNQEIVGNPIFVDYCHLSPEGYKVIMAPIAEYVANCKFKIGREEKKCFTVNPFYLATAYFCIALYNIHLNRPITNKIEMGKYMDLFQKSVDYCDSVLDIMELYVKARGCQFGTGFSLSKAGQKMSELLNSPLDLPIAQQAPGVDAFTITCICDILTSNGRDGKKLLKEYQQA